MPTARTINPMSFVELEPGKSLATIADSELGDLSKWRELAKANGIDIFKSPATALGLPKIQIPPTDELEAWALSQSRNAVNDLKGAVTNSPIYKDVDRITGGQLTKFVDSQLKTVDGAVEKFVKGQVGGLLKGISKSKTYEGVTKVLDWLY